MRRRATNIEHESAADHVVAGVLSALAMMVTVVLGVLFAATQAGPDMLGVFRSVQVWGAILVAAAFAVGIIAGPSRMAALYGHLWGTEKPERPWVTLGLWGSIAAVIAITYFASQ